MQAFENLFIAVVLAVVILGGPFTLYALVKLFAALTGRIKVRFVRTDVEATEAAPLGILVDWDEMAMDSGITRVKVDFSEFVRGGRSTSFSFTFEDKSARKKSFVIPMRLDPNDLAMLTDDGIPAQRRALQRSYVVVEVENVKGDVIRRKYKKSAVIKMINEAPVKKSADLDVVAPMSPDSWSVMSRVFPWRVIVAAADIGGAGGAPVKKTAKKGPAAPKIFDFIVTKVWIEPGCIVCDACENEAPDVFEVLADTCIVRPNAPLGDVGAIVAGAEGCPVNVIKYDTAPKA